MKSRKSILLIAIVALSMISVPAFSQLKIGLKGDVGINKPVFDETLYSVENLNGFKVGPTIEFMVPVINIGVDASLLYNNERMNVKSIGELTNVKITNHYIDIPVNVKFKFGIISPLKVYAAAGPYVKFRVGGDEFKDLDFGEIDLEDHFEDFIESRPLEAGINLGIGAEVINRVQIGFNYGIKLTDNFTFDEDKIMGNVGEGFLNALNGKKGTWSISATVFLN